MIDLNKILYKSTEKRQKTDLSIQNEKKHIQKTLFIQRNLINDVFHKNSAIDLGIDKLVGLFALAYKSFCVYLVIFS